ncbi:MAG: carboxypeptidase-like regulatory domain-containing protein [Bacteroidia bacterium]
MFLGIAPLAAQDLTQVVRGQVLAAQTSRPLAGVVLTLPESTPPLRTETDAEGRFRFDAVPVGRHILSAVLAGYADHTIPDLAVIAGKETVLEIVLEEQVFEASPVEITAGTARDLRRVSTRLFTVEETKRFAAVYFDPARMAASFPGVIQANDQANSLIVRGNSPNGISWRMEGVDIVNPNHLTNAGTFSDRLTQSGGGTIILSTQLLDNSSFSTGAFAPQYGNALAGIFDIHLRRGNNERYEFTGQAGLIGVDLAAEGPMGSRGASFLVNYRYSTVGLLGLMGITFGSESITYQDLAFNLHLPTARAGVFTLFGMGGTSSNRFTGQRDDSLRTEQKDFYDIDFRSNMGAAGLTHRITLGPQTALRSVLAVSGISSTRFGDLILAGGDTRRVEADTLDQTRVSLATTLTHRFGPRASLMAGSYFSHLGFRMGSGQQVPLFGGDFRAVNFADGGSQLIQPFASLHYHLATGLEADAGLHAMYFLLNGSSALEPRLSLRWEARPRISFRLAYGLHSQLQQPGTYFAVVARPDGTTTRPNLDLGFTRAHHIVLSYNHLLADNLHLRVEPYFQQLFDVPVVPDAARPLSALNFLEGYVEDSLVNAGTGRNYGIEFALEKYLSNRYYFLLSTSLYQSKYSAWDGIERDTRFNGNYLFNLTGGREFEWDNRRGRTKVLGINFRVIYQGGFRAMPIDLAASQQRAQTVFVEGAGFSERFPDYFRTDLRVTYQRHSKRFTSTLGIDIQNLTNRRNVAFYAYDLAVQDVVTRYQLGMIPLLSYRVEF